MAKHPIQPIEWDDYGVVRFKSNAIVRRLLDVGPLNMNSIASEEFSSEDREQFAQLIGYSVSGFGDLSYASGKTIKKADEMVKELGPFKKPEKKKFIVAVLQTQRFEVEIEAENEKEAMDVAKDYEYSLDEFGKTNTQFYDEEIVGVREVK